MNTSASSGLNDAFVAAPRPMTAAFAEASRSAGVLARRRTCLGFDISVRARSEPVERTCLRRFSLIKMVERVRVVLREYRSASFGDRRIDDPQTVQLVDRGYKVAAAGCSSENIFEPFEEYTGL